MFSSKSHLEGPREGGNNNYLPNFRVSSHLDYHKCATPIKKLKLKKYTTPIKKLFPQLKYYYTHSKNIIHTPSGKNIIHTPSSKNIIPLVKNISLAKILQPLLKILITSLVKN